MTPFGFHTSASLYIGRDAVAALGDRIRSQVRADRVLIVTDANLVAAGLVERVLAPLKAAGIATSIFDGCTPEPPSTIVLAAVEAAKGFSPSAVLGLGGGSNMDTAKLVAMLLAHGGTLDDYVGDSRVPGPVVPIVAVPTTAGTGSEVSPAAVYTDVAKAIKVSCLSPYLRPALAVVDAALTDRCPTQVTADSGIDALTHAVETFTAVSQAEFVTRSGGTTVYQGKNAIADLFALEAIRLVGLHLDRAVHEPTNRDARNGMALAATLGGLAFSNAGVALTHAMEYPVGGAVHVSHGAGNGLLLPHVMRFNASVCASTIAQLGPSLDVSTDADAVIARIEALSAAVGIPRTLRDLGVTSAMLPDFAEKAFAVKRLMRVNPRMPTAPAELLAVYEAAF